MLREVDVDVALLLQMGEEKFDYGQAVNCVWSGSVRPDVVAVIADFWRSQGAKGSVIAQPPYEPAKFCAGGGAVVLRDGGGVVSKSLCYGAEAIRFWVDSGILGLGNHKPDALLTLAGVVARP